MQFPNSQANGFPSHAFLEQWRSRAFPKDCLTGVKYRPKSVMAKQKKEVER